MPVSDLIPSRGATAAPLTFTVVRALTVDDLAYLADAPLVGAPPIQSISARHHRQAQLIAEGKPLAEVALIVGSTPQRLGQLMKDPTFKELVVMYHDQIAVTQFEDGQRIRGKLTDIAETAIDELAERLDTPEKRKSIHVSELRKMAELGLDRTVAPPKTAASTPTVPAQITFSFSGTVQPAPPAAKPGDDAKLIEQKAEE